MQHYHGISVPTNHEQALHFFIQSSQLGNAEAMGAAIYFSRTGTPVNKKKTLEYFQMAAAKGHLKSTVIVAKILNNGDGVHVNQKEAAKYFKQAADAGDSRSMYNYANMLRDGHGVGIDRMEGLKYYKMAPDLSDVDTMYLLSMDKLQWRRCPSEQIRGC